MTHEYELLAHGALHFISSHIYVIEGMANLIANELMFRCSFTSEETKYLDNSETNDELASIVVRKALLQVVVLASSEEITLVRDYLNN